MRLYFNQTAQEEERRLGDEQSRAIFQAQLILRNEALIAKVGKKGDNQARKPLARRVIKELALQGNHVFDDQDNLIQVVQSPVSYP